MFILSFKKTYTKNEIKKKLYLVGEGMNSMPSFFAKIFLKRAVISKKLKYSKETWYRHGSYCYY